MVQILGNASAAITGGEGIDIPLVPRAVSRQQETARQRRQIDMIEAAEGADTPAAERGPAAGGTPLPRRRGRRADALSLPVAARRKPAPKPETPTEPESLVEPEPEASEPEVVPGFEVDAPTQVRQLRTELAMAGQRITTLLGQVEEQGACIANAVSDVATATSLAAQLSELATEQQDLLRARADAAERELKAARRQIEALITELAAAMAAAADSQDHGDKSDEGEHVLCLGTGCGLPVAPEYVLRTGYLWHGPCKDRIPAAVRFYGRRVA